MEWCKEEAKKKNLKDCDYWGGLVIDEMSPSVKQNKSYLMVNLFVFGEISDFNQILPNFLLDPHNRF